METSEKTVYISTEYSQNLNELFAALAKAQGQMTHAKKDKKNPFFKSSYADLASVWEVCREPLTNNGLSLSQQVEGSKTEMQLVTMLGHSSGQWIRSKLPLLLQKLDPQSLGSALTYARRYAMSAMVGICADEDDDGEKAMARKNRTVEADNVTPAYVTSKQADELDEILSQCDPSYQASVKKTLDSYKIPSLKYLPVEMHERLKAAALKNRDGQKEKVA